MFITILSHLAAFAAGVCVTVVAMLLLIHFSDEDRRRKK